MAPSYVVVYNTSDTPALLDSMGRTLGGHEWSAARRGATLDDAANRAHVVVLTSIDRSSASREAQRAADQADKWNEAARTFDGVELDAIRELAAEHVDPAAGDLDRVDLVDLLVRAGVTAAPPTPEPPPSKAAARRTAPDKPEE